MILRDLFQTDVTRDIPPVVYFHEQSPAKLASEVGEYIITGGFPEDDPRARRVKSGIHEQFVSLLRQMARELAKPGGPELPASWISGFFGSGKSSFAKLLGLALDGVVLPDGTALATALLRRDDSPRAAELAAAWESLRGRIDPIAVVFDIGAVARDNEQIHAALLRQVQARLEYCAKSHLVAEHELKLERDGQWEAFLAVAQQTLGRPWSEASRDEQADDHFSEVMHRLNPERYQEPMSWIDSRAGARHGIGTSAQETVDAIAAMLERRAPGKTLIAVVDEVSQYIHQDESRMLALQSLVTELGQRLRGRAWILATGQQKLEETSASENLGKLKDRFPPALRVHLDPANIRDVVHKRLLAKAPDRLPALRELFARHRPDLKLYAYGCEQITEEDFLEVYPLLPGHIDLLMQITSNLRTRSSRVQGDDHAIRGLLQLLGELFRTQGLAEREVGALVTLDAIFEVQQSALDADVQTTLARIFAHPDLGADPLAVRAAKAVALLEVIQEQLPTTAELVAKCLYASLGAGDGTPAVAAALDRLRHQSLVSYSEKLGYKIQSSSGQEWAKERGDLGVTQDQISAIVQDKLRELLAVPERPRLRGRPFPWGAWYSDGKQARDVRLVDPRDEAAVTVDFQFLGARPERAEGVWVPRSDQGPLRDRLVWVVGDAETLLEVARELVRSRHMMRRYESRRDSLPREKQRLLIEETARAEDLEGAARERVAAAFMDGAIYFRGRSLRPRDESSAFATALLGIATRFLPELYTQFTEIAVTEGELAQLLEPTLSGPSTKFLEGLGILSLDAGKYVPTCHGPAPARILQYIVDAGGASGGTVMAHFGRPPYGYAADVVRACLAGLLRASRIRIRPEQGPEITSVRDPGARDLFRRDRDLRRADLFPPRDQAISARDRVAICKVFKDHLGVELDRENDAIADAVFDSFPGRRERLREVEAQLERLPGRPPLPPALAGLAVALEDCRRSRQVEDTVLAVKKHLDALADGLQQLEIFRSELTDQAIGIVRDAAETRDHHLAQLRHAEMLGGVEAEAAQLEQELATDRPWRGAQALEAAAARLRAHYAELRRSLLTTQNAEAEAARGRVMGRPGFARLSGDQSHQVLRPITEALFDTSAEAVAPTLVEVRDRFRTRLAEAETRANDVLDDILSRLDERRVPFVKIALDLPGREIASREQLDALLREIEERVAAQLARGARVRLI